MKVQLSRLFASTASALVLVSMAATGASAAPAAAPGAPKIGVRYFAESGGQCGGMLEDQWAESPNWTSPIRLDTDNQSGGCQLAFGLMDPGGVMPGLLLKYKWQVTAGGDPTQCGLEEPANTPAGIEHTIKPAPYETYGPPIRIDTDGRAGWCNLTFTLEGRTDVAVDVEYLRENDTGQCIGWLPSGRYHRVSVFTPPVTIGDDTDNRPGGCTLRLRVMKF